jgi:hypothetical protein
LGVLRSFRLGNHRSFRDEQELLLMPAGPGDERSAAPVAAIYGANASGKSNLLNGLEFMRSAVLDSFAQWEVEGAVPRRPFKLAPESRLEPSVFVVELVTDEIRYTYGFALDDDCVREEWLYSYPEKRKRVIFERERDEIKLGSTVTEMKAKLEVLEELMRPNALFLSACARLTLDPLMPVYRWFNRSLRIRPGSDPFGVTTTVARFLAKDSGNTKRLLALLAAADVGIVNVHVDEYEDPRRIREIHRAEKNLAELVSRGTGPESADFSQEIAKARAELAYVRARGAQRRTDLKFVHDGSDEAFDLRDESAGTRNWLALIPAVLTALDSASVFVVDEIDASLHPLLTARLVSLFQDGDTNPNGAQLIFTTHDTSLLGTMLGDQMLDRDQIWFVEKKRGASELYALSDFKPRKEQNTERRYLAGSYGAVPVLDRTSFADAVLDR